jgi:predicted ABC-type ATPase
MPELYIITGSNGAGKSSTGSEYIPKPILEKGPVFDGDKLFMEKRHELWKNIRSNKECKRLAYEFVTQTFDQLVETALSRNFDLAYEGHFTNEATWDIPRRFLKAGYSIHLIFLGLEDIELSHLRVIDRSKTGGHYVDPRTLSDNFYGNLEKLDQHHDMFHSLRIIDSSLSSHIVLAVLENGIPTNFVNSETLPQWFRSYLPTISLKIKDCELKA